MQTILGAGGPISNALASIITEKNEPLRLVSRRPVTTTGNTTWMRGDLKDYNSLIAAAKGTTVIYLCAGLQYDKEVWKAEWPLIMQNVIRLTKETGARLIFFDNVYMYGRVNGAMTETTPNKPDSVKGTVRAQIADTLLAEVSAGHINASIARAADFYGAESLNSVMDLMVLSNLSKGKAAQWVGNVHAKHSYTYVPDAAMGMYLLGQNPDTDNQIWHMPTAAPLTGVDYINIAAKAFDTKPKHVRIGKFILSLMAPFNKQVSESVEMFYQNKYDYIFDSSKFNKRFNFTPTSFKDGIAQLKDGMFKPKVK